MHVLFLGDELGELYFRRLLLFEAILFIAVSFPFVCDLISYFYFLSPFNLSTLFLTLFLGEWHQRWALESSKANKMALRDPTFWKAAYRAIDKYVRKRLPHPVLQPEEPLAEGIQVDIRVDIHESPPLLLVPCELMILALYPCLVMI